MIRRKRDRLTTALFCNAAAIALIGIALMMRGNSKWPELTPSAMAQQQLPIGGGAGVFIVPAQFSGTTFGCYIMDVDAQTLCAYQFIPGEHNLRLVAARSYQYDRRLKFYSTTPPPNEIKMLVEKEQSDIRGIESPRDNPDAKRDGDAPNQPDK